MSNKAFIFLYPELEIFEIELERFGDEYRQEYKQALNQCIDLRYRQKGFTINYALLDGDEVSNIIELQKSDNVIYVGMDFITHRTEVDGEYPYPDQDHILDQLGDIQIIRVAGFHAYSCCEKLAKRAFERGLDSMVDEELTQFFLFDFKRPDFKPDQYPSVDQTNKFHGDYLTQFFKVRRSRPWLWDWEQGLQLNSQ